METAIVNRPEVTAITSFRRTGVLMFELEMFRPNGENIIAQTHAFAILQKYFEASATDQQVVTLPVALKKARIGPLEIDGGYQGFPAKLLVPTQALATPIASGCLLQKAQETVNHPIVKALSGEMPYQGERYDMHITGSDRKGVLIVRASQINLGDIGAQRPTVRIYALDPKWKGEEPYLRVTGPPGDTFARSGACTHLREQVKRAERVAAEITEAFRTMTPENPPQLPDDVKRDLDLLGEHALDNWCEGAVKGDANAVRQLAGKACSIRVRILMREKISNGSDFTSGFPLISPGICILPLNMAKTLLELCDASR
ncbi:MAG: hypothetical protein WC813_02395 [Patescibacteria group bacterium]